MSNLPVQGGNRAIDAVATSKNIKGNTTAMKRLVYSPRAYVFIKDSSGTIHDLTHYVVSGNVDRLTDQVSTAEITLRNPNHLFTTHLEGDTVVEAKFSPMDPITIYLRRVRNRPVRVFTGFLNTGHYLQLFPGTITLKASCTLKRLLHTYFDPALPYTQSFLTTYGWIPYNGQWVSLTGMKEWLAPGTDPATVKNNSNASTKVIGKGSKITLIGDSIGEGVIQSSKIPQDRLAHNSVRGRSTSAGVSVLKTFARNGNLTETVVLCLGSNDDPGNTAAFKALVEEAVKVVGPQRHLIWVNLHGTNYLGNSLTPLNPILDDVATANPNMTVIHWNTIVENESIQMDTHGIHTNTAGYARLANEIVKTADSGALAGSDGNKLQPPKAIDGSLSQLLFATLEHIGHWSPNDIYIEPMPEKLFDHLRDLATEFAHDSELAKEEFKKFITDVIGGGSHGSPTGNSGATLGGQVKGQDKITQTIKKIADKYNIDPAMAMAVADIESGYGTNMHRPGAPYHGWYQINIGGSRYSKPITVAQANDLQYSCTLFCKGAASTVPDSVKKQGPLAWAMYTQGVNGSNNPLYPQEWPTAYAKAKKFISQYTGSGATSLGPATNLGTVDQTVRSDKKGGTNKGSGKEVTITDPKELIDRVVLPIARKHKIDVTPASVDAANARHGPTQGGNPSDHQGPPAQRWAADMSNGLTTPQEDELAAELAKVFNIPWSGSGLITHSEGGFRFQLIYRIDTAQAGNHFTHVHFGVAKESSGASWTGVPGADASSSTVGGSATPGDPSGTGADPGAAGAFFATLDLPSAYDAVEASMLTGEKSLLNDKPLLPFIQQLCSASLRHFQSLPDGRFYGFYPDYFGEMNQHPPYWEIDDVEILDGGIELTDDPLVTHEYVVGDTVTPMTGDSPFAMRSVFSSGSINVFNAFMANDVLDRTKARQKDKQKAQRQTKKHKNADNAKNKLTGMGILLDRQEVAAFLQRYGARPNVEDMPMIKSPYYEMFLAYQKFLLAWSKQFSTPFMFTFMPELFPGGKVAFPNHGLQMYIEQVNHSWDYESGFTTTASLTAPSEYGQNTGLLPPNMVQAIIRPSAQNADQ